MKGFSLLESPDFFENLGEVSKLMLMRVLKPESLIHLIQLLIQKKLGDDFVDFSVPSLD